MTSKKSLSKSYIMMIIRNHRTILLIMPIAIIAFNILSFYIHESTLSFYGSSPYSLSTLITVGLIGLFILPLVLSCVLFNYVYKAEKLDFIGSLPMSRKRVYLTNIAFGIGYIICIFLINFIVILGYAFLKGSILCSPAILFDANFTLCLSYIVLFSACALAACVSGNTITQIVVAVLILTVIPFFRLVTMGVNFMSNDVELIINDEVTYRLIETYTENNFELFTYPYYMLGGSVLNAYMPIINIKTIIYSIVAVGIYLAAGYYMYINRKMENVGTSFKEDKIHVVVKALTLLPMIFIVFLAITTSYDSSSEIISFVIRSFIPITIYYFVYDLILRKKIPFKENLLYYVISVVAIFMLFTILYAPKLNQSKDFDLDKVYPEEIAYIEVEKNNDYLFNNYSYYTEDLFGDYIEVKEEKIINELVNELSKSNESGYARYADSKILDNKSMNNVRFHINGKVYNTDVPISDKLYNIIYPKSERMEEAEKEITIKGEAAFVIRDDYYNAEFNYKKVDKNLRKVFNDRIPYIIKNYDPDKYNLRHSDINLYIAKYENHMSKSFFVKITEDKELFEYLVNNILNKEYANVKNIDSVLTVQLVEGDDKEDYLLNSKKVSFYEDLHEAIKHGIDAGFDSNKSYFCISIQYYDKSEKDVGDRRKSVVTYVNNVDELKAVFEKYGDYTKSNYRYNYDNYEDDYENDYEDDYEVYVMPAEDHGDYSYDLPYRSEF